MLRDDQIKDETWRDEADKRWGYLFGRGGFYAACNNGWRGIIENMLEDIDEHVRATGIEEFQITDVKEKWGSLRVSCWGEDDRISALVDVAEERSARTCEICGAPGRIYGEGWVMARCGRHRPKEGN